MSWWSSGAPVPRPITSAKPPSTADPDGLRHRSGDSRSVLSPLQRDGGAAYVGSRGRDLPGVIEPNFTGGFPQSARPDPRQMQFGVKMVL